MRILVVADPIARLRPQSDTSLVLAREALRHGHEVYWAVDQDVEFAGDVAAWAGRISDFAKDTLPAQGKLERHPLHAMDAVWIRKDPPFDAGYVRLCWLLQLAESKVWMLNRPSLLLRYHEKLIPLEARAQGFLEKDDVIATHIGAWERAQAHARDAHWAQVITKPFLGYGGGGVELMSSDEFFRKNPNPGDEERLVQPFREEVTRQGDRRVFFLGGELMAQFVRMPKAGGFISNLAQGGSAVAAPLDPGQREVLERLGAFLKHVGLDFAGADLIGHRISEVNVTSPMGLRSLEKLEGHDHADRILEFIEKRVRDFRAALSIGLGGKRD